MRSTVSQVWVPRATSRLVGDDHERQAEGFEGRQCFRSAGDDPDLGGRGWRIGFSVADDGLVENPVAIQENGSLHRTDFHLVSVCFIGQDGREGA
jgi:hypothetical protein